jgi:hypothetical protein
MRSAGTPASVVVGTTAYLGMQEIEEKTISGGDGQYHLLCAAVAQRESMERMTGINYHSKTYSVRAQNENTHMGTYEAYLYSDMRPKKPSTLCDCAIRMPIIM